MILSPAIAMLMFSFAHCVMVFPIIIFASSSLNGEIGIFLKNFIHTQKAGILNNVDFTMKQQETGNEDMTISQSSSEVFVYITRVGPFIKLCFSMLTVMFIKSRIAVAPCFWITSNTDQWEFTHF